jgi:hypothetical protein
VGPSPVWTPGQRQFWDQLDESQRERFGQLSPGKQREILAMAREGPTPLLLQILKAELKPRQFPPTVPPAATVFDLVWLLADKGVLGQTILPSATEAVCQELGDQKRSWPYWHGQLFKVLTGDLPAEAVIDPLRKTLALRGTVKEPRNLAGYCTQSHENWIRENAG